MRAKRLLFILIPALSLSLAGLAWSESGEDEDEDVSIALADTPQAVRDAVKALTPADKVTEVERETEEGFIVYDVEYETDAGTATVIVSEGGEVLATELELTEEGLPATVRKALAQRFEGAKVLEANSITLHYYYFEVKVKVGDDVREVKVLASGQLAEDDESAEDEDHDGDEEDDDDHHHRGGGDDD